MRRTPRPLWLAGLWAGLMACGCSANKPVEVYLETRETRGGVEYVDLLPGRGEQVVHGSQVVVHYVASLEDDTVFDSSYDRGLPEKFVVGEQVVLPGWEQGLLGMRAGGQRRMVVPPELAYGSEGLDGLVPPDATIILVVDLLETTPP